VTSLYMMAHDRCIELDHEVVPADFCENCLEYVFFLEFETRLQPKVEKIAALEAKVETLEARRKLWEQAAKNIQTELDATREGGGDAD